MNAAPVFGSCIGVTRQPLITSAYRMADVDPDRSLDRPADRLTIAPSVVSLGAAPGWAGMTALEVMMSAPLHTGSVVRFHCRPRP